MLMMLAWLGPLWKKGRPADAHDAGLRLPKCQNQVPADAHDAGLLWAPNVGQKAPS